MTAYFFFPLVTIFLPTGGLEEEDALEEDAALEEDDALEAAGAGVDDEDEADGAGTDEDETGVVVPGVLGFMTILPFSRATSQLLNPGTAIALPRAILAKHSARALSPAFSAPIRITSSACPLLATFNLLCSSALST